jgi:hypothetical protein
MVGLYHAGRGGRKSYFRVAHHWRKCVVHCATGEGVKGDLASKHANKGRVKHPTAQYEIATLTPTGHTQNHFRIFAQCPSQKFSILRFETDGLSGNREVSRHFRLSLLSDNVNNLRHYEFGDHHLKRTLGRNRAKLPE